jgi:hypothetical protein
MRLKSTATVVPSTASGSPFHVDSSQLLDAAVGSGQSASLFEYSVSRASYCCQFASWSEVGSVSLYPTH